MAFAAIQSFLKAHNNFESTQSINAVFEELQHCTSMNDIFNLPLSHKMLNMDAALHFMIFLSKMPDAFKSELDSDDLEAPFVGKDSFSVPDAVNMITDLYDLGVSDMISPHIDEAIEDEDEDEDDEDDEEEDDEEKEDGKGRKKE